MPTTTPTPQRRRRRAQRPATPVSGFVCPRAHLAGRVRDRTTILLDACLDTFELYRRVAATSDDRAHRRIGFASPPAVSPGQSLWISATAVSGSFTAYDQNSGSFTTYDQNSGGSDGCFIGRIDGVR